MRHEHLVVTVDADTKARIEADLDAGETVEAWIADAVESKLRETEEGERSGDGNQSGRGDGHDRTAEEAREQESETEESEYRNGGASYDEGFEFVDDCSI